MPNYSELSTYIESNLQGYSERYPIAWSMFISKIKGARVSIPLSFEQTTLILDTLKTTEDNQADAERWRSLLRAIAQVEEQEDGDVVIEVYRSNWRGDPPRKLLEFISLYDPENRKSEEVK